MTFDPNRYPYLVPADIAPPGLLIVVTCDFCGYRHHLERRRRTAEVITVVCHGCETVLRAEFRPGPEHLVRRDDCGAQG